MKLENLILVDTRKNNLKEGEIRKTTVPSYPHQWLVAKKKDGKIIVWFEDKTYAK